MRCREAGPGSPLHMRSIGATTQFMALMSAFLAHKPTKAWRSLPDYRASGYHRNFSRKDC